MRDQRPQTASWMSLLGPHPQPGHAPHWELNHDLWVHRPLSQLSHTGQARLCHLKQQACYNICDVMGNDKEILGTIQTCLSSLMTKCLKSCQNKHLYFCCRKAKCCPCQEAEGEEGEGGEVLGSRLKGHEAHQGEGVLSRGQRHCLESKGPRLRQCKDLCLEMFPLSHDFLLKEI